MPSGWLDVALAVGAALLAATLLCAHVDTRLAEQRDELAELSRRVDTLEREITYC